MTILDKSKTNLAVAVAAVSEAARGEDIAALEESLLGLGQTIEQNVLAEYENLRGERDTAVLAARGVRQLTSAENGWYKAIARAAEDKNPVMALQDLDVVMPETILNQVFEDLKQEHPLLDAVNFVYGKGITKWMFSTDGTQKATWGALTKDITDEISAGFKSIDISQNSLSAFLPVSKAVLALGPEWLDRYIRALLVETLALGLENGIINGKGQTENIKEPVGMIRDLKQAVDQSEGYKEKTAEKITRIAPATIGALVSKLCQNENGKPRKYNDLILVVNSVDYLEKVMPATTAMSPAGTYINNILPVSCKVILSETVPSGKAIFGLGKRYAFVCGSPGGKEGFVDYSDHCNFLKNERVYLTMLYGHGQPLDNNCFTVLDISELEPLYYPVRMMESATAANIEA